MKPTILIISGGSSSRMYPLNSSRHKGLIPLAGQSLIYRTIAQAYKKDFRKFVIVVNPNGDNAGLESAIKNDFADIEIGFVTQDTANGMGDAVSLVKDHLDDQFIILAPYHFSAMHAVEKLLNTNAPAAICTTSTETPWRYGIVEVEKGNVKSIVEKPEKGTEPSKQKAVACYLLNRQFLDILETVEDTHYNFEIALNALMKQTTVAAIELEENLPSLKYPWQLFDLANEYFEVNETTHISETASVAETAVLDDSRGAIIIDDNATVGHAAKVVGPTYIGRNALVGDFSFVRQSVLEEDATIGANTEVVRCIIMEKSSLHFGYMADSILDTNVKVGAGLITANKRLDRENISVTYDDKKIQTNTNALGIIAGEGAAIGIQVGTMPGVVIGPNSKIFPGTTVFNSVGENEVQK
jgi:bifunctional UDP-N-acetylglucosamine pyrophosphorylase/glucosamine-1-phosphate N-acetyltransferase